MSAIQSRGIELNGKYELAHREWVYARQELDDVIGNKLRAHQQVIFSVLQKVNGKSLHHMDTPNFHKGSGTWAVALKDGFEVINITKSSISIRALVSPSTNAKPVTYSLGAEWLTYSDRDVAKLIRSDVRRLKERDKDYEIFTNKRKAKTLEKEIAKKNSEVQKLESDLSAMKKAETLYLKRELMNEEKKGEVK